MFDECFIPDEDWGDLFYNDNIDIFDEVLESAPDLDDYDDYDDYFDDLFDYEDDEDERFGL